MQSPEGWSKTVRDRWFFGALTLSMVSVGYLFSPFLYVLLFAVVVVVVAWPLFARILVRVRGRRSLAAGLTVALLAILVFGPFTLLAYLFVNEAVHVAQAGLAFVNSGKLAQWIAYVLALPHNDHLPAWVRDLLPQDFDAVAGPAQSAALVLLNSLRTAVPGLVGSTVSAVLDALIFIFAVFSLFVEGPALLAAFRSLSPLDDRYEDRLLEVFREFSVSMVVGSVATALVQGVVAGVGYWIAGVERVFFYAILTAAFAFVPMVGTVLIWVPLSVVVAVDFGWKWGLFLFVWSAVFTTQVDGLVRPLFLRGKTEIHPLLVLLAAFGGIAWMGLPGALVGPVLVAFFVSLYQIFREEHQGPGPQEP